MTVLSGYYAKTVSKSDLGLTKMFVVRVLSNDDGKTPLDKILRPKA